MKATIRRSSAFVAGVFLAMMCMLMTASGGFTLAVETASAAVTPTVWVYLPYISIQEPPAATPTLTPTQKKTPALTPTPTSTTNPTGVYILSNHSSYVDSIDYLHIVGEVQNNTADHLRFVKITANIFNGNGQLLDTDFTYTYLDNLPPGDRTCFVVLLPKPTGWSYYQFEAPTYWRDGQPLPNLTVTQHSGSYNSTFRWYEIIGQVRNDHGARVQYVSPIGTVYNASNVVGCDFTYVNSTDLDPSQTSSFKLTFSGRDYTDVRSYRLQVDGNLP